MPSTRPHLRLNKEGVCDACVVTEKKNMDIDLMTHLDCFYAIKLFFCCFSSLGNLNRGTGTSLNKQESFFLAELLKYLYLAHTTKQEFDPTKFILTTEAHPLQRFR